MDKEAEQLVNSFYVGDTAHLIEATIEEERKCSNLDESKLKAAWEMLMAVPLRNCVLTRRESGRIDVNGHQASAKILFRDPTGAQGTLLAMANKSEEGVAKTNVLASMFLFSCLFDDSGHFRDDISPSIQLAKLRKVRPRLESLGIHRLMVNPRRCHTWDEFERILVISEERATELRSKKIDTSKDENDLK